MSQRVAASLAPITAVITAVDFWNLDFVHLMPFMPKHISARLAGGAVIIFPQTRKKALQARSANPLAGTKVQHQATQTPHEDCITCPGSQQSVQTGHEHAGSTQEEAWFCVLKLNAAVAPNVTKQLHVATSAQSLHTWELHQANQTIYSIRLIADVQQPDNFVAISAHDLMCHSQWGVKQLHQAGI